MKVGELVWDYALGNFGIVIDGAWTEYNSAINEPSARSIPWEWLVLYADGELEGADTGDLKVVE